MPTVANTSLKTMPTPTKAVGSPLFSGLPIPPWLAGAKNACLQGFVNLFDAGAHFSPFAEHAN